MYHYHRKQPGSFNTRRSRHADDLVQRRRQRIHGTYGHKVKNRENATRPIESTIASAIPAEQAVRMTTEASISINLLGKVTMLLHSPGGHTREVLLNLSTKTIQLLAYLAWKRRAGIRRDQLLEDIWGCDGTGEETSSDTLGEAFNNAKKSLRSTGRKAVEELNAEHGEVVLNPKLDIFEKRYQMLWLSSICRVIDLEEIEMHYQVIKEAEKSGTLYNIVPEQVAVSCYAILAKYTGDYLQWLTQYYEDAFDPWYSSWVRGPITQYRDYYLQALWYAALYERQVAKSILGGDSASNTGIQREHNGKAAELYKTYAMSACSNKFDLKVYFGSNRGDGERVVRSEEAIRHCIKLYGQLGSLYLIDVTYSAYSGMMSDISSENWGPSKETLRVVQAAKELAAAYLAGE